MTDLTEEEKITKAAYDKYGKAWAAANVMGDFWRPYIHKFHRILPEGNILEIGCGSGRDAQDLIKLGYGYTGTDITDSFIDFCRQRLPGQKFIRQSVYDLYFPGHKFDGFWACASLIHVPKARMGEALQSIKSVVKLGGVGFISLKDGDNEYVRRDKIADLDMERFFAYWKKNEFALELERNGFKIVNYEFNDSQETKWHCFFVKTT